MGSAWTAVSRKCWSAWDDASLGSVLRYVRGSAFLELPESWKQLLPDESLMGE